MTEMRRGGFIGQIALERGLITVEDIGRALDLQQEYRRAGNRVPRVGEIFVGMGLLSAEDVRDLLRCQNSMLGEAPEAVAEESVPPVQEAAEPTARGWTPEACEYREGESFGNYNLIRRVGYGPLGSAWCATHGEDKKKQLLLRIFSVEAMGCDCDVVTNFEHHIIKATRLEHSGLQRIIRGGLYDDRYYYVCEFDEGQSLRNFLEEAGRFSPGKALELLTQIAAALQYGHGKGVLHNHISPSSIIILPGFEVKLSAYGMMPDPVGNVRLMAQELGKMPFYVAPELVVADGDISVAGTWSDFYSLGAVLFHCLVGLPPFYAATLEEVLPLMHDTKNLEQKLKDSELDEDLIRLVLLLLAPDPGQRVKTAGELLVALAPLVDRYPFKKPKAEQDRKTGAFAKKGGRTKPDRKDIAQGTDRPQRLGGEDFADNQAEGTGSAGSASRKRGTTVIRKNGTATFRKEPTALNKRVPDESTSGESGSVSVSGFRGRSGKFKPKTDTNRDGTKGVSDSSESGWKNSRTTTDVKADTDGNSSRSSRSRRSDRKKKKDAEVAAGGGVSVGRILIGIGFGLLLVGGVFFYILSTAGNGAFGRMGNFRVNMDEIKKNEEQRLQKEERERKAIAAVEEAKRKADEEAREKAEAAKVALEAEKAAAEKAAAEKVKKESGEKDASLAKQTVEISAEEKDDSVKAVKASPVEESAEESPEPEAEEESDEDALPVKRIIKRRQTEAVEVKPE